MAATAAYAGPERRYVQRRAGVSAYDAAALVPLVARVLVSALFLVAGARKALTFAATAGYLAKLGFPAPEAMAALAVLIELGCGLMLLIGWRARAAAWLLAIFVVVATFAAHRFWEFDAAQMANQMNHFLKNAAIVGALMYVVSFGAGRLSVDRR